MPGDDRATAQPAASDTDRVAGLATTLRLEFAEDRQKRNVTADIVSAYGAAISGELGLRRPASQRHLRSRMMLFCAMNGIQRHAACPSLPSPSLRMTSPNGNVHR